MREPAPGFDVLPIHPPKVITPLITAKPRLGTAGAFRGLRRGNDNSPSCGSIRNSLICRIFTHGSCCYASKMDEKTTRVAEGFFVAVVLGVAMWVAAYLLIFD